MCEINPFIAVLLGVSMVGFLIQALFIESLIRENDRLRRFIRTGG